VPVAVPLLLVRATLLDKRARRDHLRLTKAAADMLKIGVLVVGLALLCSGHVVVAQSASPSAGAATFRLNCSPCHTKEPGHNSIGPSLYGVVGRRAASLPTYSYSPAMKQSEIVWTEENIANFLSSPGARVPGTKMTFAGISEADRRDDLVAYLKTLQAKTLQAPAN
jgi:cytochrome c